MAAEVEGTDSSDEERTSSPLDKAGEFAKYLTALATGALVFSAELLKKDYSLSGPARVLLFGSWVCLALSAIGGLAVMARIPLMMVKKLDSLEDEYLEPPLRAQQIFLLLGIIALGVAFATALWMPPSSSKDDEKKLAVSCIAPEPESERFTLSASAPTQGKSTTHQHTFLLDRRTGSIWQMVCNADKTVRFVKVEVEKATDVH